MQRREFNQLLNDILKPHLIKDFCPNGLQVEGKNEIKTIILQPFLYISSLFQMQRL